MTNADGHLLDAPDTSSNAQAKAVDLTVESVKASDDMEKNDAKGANEMKETVHIEGMMCGHCEATVKKALEALPQVDHADVSHESGTAVITLNAPVEEAVLKKVIEDKDYKFVSVEA